MVYVPLAHDRARALRQGAAPTPLAGHAATASLRRALALAHDDEEGDGTSHAAATPPAEDLAAV